MTTRDTFGRDLSHWLREEGERPLAIIAVVIGALLLAALAAVWAASQRPSTFELASNGRIFVVDGQTLKSYAAGGADPQVVQDLPASAVAPCSRC